MYKSKLYQRKLAHQREIEDKLKKYGKEIFFSKNFKKTKENIQHGNMSVKRHSLRVAAASLSLAHKLHIPCEEKDLIRGALLHDYFLYDWHKKDNREPGLHGFYHPARALKNAKKEYQLSPREKDIIAKHMFPMTVKPPLCREAWVVTMADKYCSLLETIHVHKGDIRE